jgi:aminoglycoside/choline kinase family phosphotransferase
MVSLAKSNYRAPTERKWPKPNVFESVLYNYVPPTSTRAFFIIFAKNILPLKNIQNELSLLFYNSCKVLPETITSLPLSGSDRKYYRVINGNISAIGVYNSDKKENNAFIEFTQFFRQNGLNVPELLGVNQETDTWLLSDLGDTTLFAKLTSARKEGNWTPELTATYKAILRDLIDFQILGKKGFVFNHCYPRPAFDKQSMLWDLNYFKYYFLRLAHIPYDEQALENDFDAFSDFLLQTDCTYFLYRDLQSRNLMLHNDKIFFIDYQGGRQGALQYDVASLLYDAKADIPTNIKSELLAYYCQQAEAKLGVQASDFLTYFYAYVYIRIMQAMGAYGYRGFFEQKAHFLLSIPYAIGNLQWLLSTHPLPSHLKTLTNVLSLVTQSQHLKQFDFKPAKLTVSIYSFSYKKGIPIDYSGNGGGFVFDCRAIPNPGKFDEFKNLTGLDEAVRNYLSNRPEAGEFLESAATLVNKSINTYLHRQFTHLQVCFGCTGGQHRSVYSAQWLYNILKTNQSIDAKLCHRELEQK